MLKIIIVDDEAPIRDYIAYCIENSNTDCEICGSLSSGVEALKKLEKQAVDLVFADITMPRMDGLEMLSHIRNRFQETDVVMLTCHDDFSFARTALQQGAIDYILKSEIDPALMGSILKRVIEKRASDHPGQIVTKHLTLEQYLNSVLMNPDINLLDAQNIQSNLDGYRLKNYFVCLFRYDKQVLEKLANQNPSWVKRKWIFRILDNLMCLLVDFIDATNDSQQYTRKGVFVQELNNDLEGKIGTSKLYHDARLLKKAILEASKELSQKFYQSTQSFIITEADNRKELKQLYQYRNDALSAISNGNFLSFQEQIDKIFNFVSINHVNVIEFKKILTFIAEFVADMGGGKGKNLIKDITQTSNIEELKKLFCDFTEQLVKSHKKYSDNIEIAIEYIHNHFRENLTLQDVADKLFLSAEYFSRRFKQEVGVNFSEYLLELRMQEAYHLLCTTNMRVSEIASSVGIPNASYFTSIYKKYFGVSPAVSRKKMRSL